jgi:hypothetical protein
LSAVTKACAGQKGSSNYVPSQYFIYDVTNWQYFQSSYCQSFVLPRVWTGVLFGKLWFAQWLVSLGFQKHVREKQWGFGPDIGMLANSGER